jgi:hypothetical protein
MYPGMDRFLPLISVAVLLAACQVERPLDPAGERSPDMATATNLAAPSSLAATPVSSRQVALAWRDNSTGENGFEVHRSTSGPTGGFVLAVPGKTAANAVSYNDMQASPGGEYCYKVRAFKTTGNKLSYSSFSSVACARTPAPPNAPSSGNARPASSNQVIFTWQDNSSNESGSRVERSPLTTGPWGVIALLGPDQQLYGDAGRESEQQVCYRVTAFNSLGDSPASNTDCTTPPAGPTQLTIAWREDQSIDLTWEDNSASEDGYRLDRAAVGPSFGVLAYLPANSTSYHDIEANPYVIQRYRVQAMKDGGLSDQSNIASTCTSGTEEICGNGTDDDCNGWIDSEDPVCGQLDCGWDGCPTGYICEPDGICVSHCSDGAHNGDEGDVDCGGSCDAKCEAGRQCHGNFDCASNFCVNLICQ